MALGALGVVVTLVVGLASIFWQILAQSKQIKRDNSINAVAVLQKGGDLSRAMETVARIGERRFPVGEFPIISQREECAAFYASPAAFRDGTGRTEWDKDSREKSRALFAVVDYFEAVSVGVRCKIYDKKIIREIARGTFVQMYKRTKPFIEKVREDSDFKNFGRNFERVVAEFSE